MLAAHQVLPENARIGLPLAAVRRHGLVQILPTAPAAAGRHCVSLAVAVAAIRELGNH
jgi:hypothetical protein